MKKILITGPESSGKTTLAKTLARHFACPYTSEYARQYLDKLGRPYQEEDLNHILRGQLNIEKEAINNIAPLLFCDTGPEVIYIWSQVKYGHVAPFIQQTTSTHDYDLRIICYPDLEWEEDEWREAPDVKQRLELFDDYCQLHEANKWPYFVVKGKNDARFSPIVSLIEQTIIGWFTT